MRNEQKQIREITKRKFCSIIVSFCYFSIIIKQKRSCLTAIRSQSRQTFLPKNNTFHCMERKRRWPNHSTICHDSLASQIYKHQSYIRQLPRVMECYPTVPSANLISTSNDNESPRFCNMLPDTSCFQDGGTQMVYTFPHRKMTAAVKSMRNENCFSTKVLEALWKKINWRLSIKYAALKMKSILQIVKDGAWGHRRYSCYRRTFLGLEIRAAISIVKIWHA